MPIYLTSSLWSASYAEGERAALGGTRIKPQKRLACRFHFQSNGTAESDTLGPASKADKLASDPLVCMDSSDASQACLRWCNGFSFFPNTHKSTTKIDLGHFLALWNVSGVLRLTLSCSARDETATARQCNTQFANAVGMVI